MLQRASAKDKRAIRQHVERDLVLFCGSIHDFGLNGAEETRTWRARVNEAFQCLKGTTATKKVRDDRDSSVDSEIRRNARHNRKLMT